MLVIKNPPANAGGFDFLGRDYPLEKEMATCSSILAWEIPWTERSLVGCSPWGCRFLMTWYQFKSWSTVSPLYTSLQVVNLQKWECAFVCPITLKYEWNCDSPSISCCWRPFNSTTSLLLSHLHSITLLGSSLDASPSMPSVVWYYCTSQGTVL